MQFGLDGLMAYYQNNHFHFTELGGLDVRGATNMPGVLYSGTCSAGGGISNKWGKFQNTTSVTRTVSGSTVTYVIPHDVGHGNYQVQITQQTANVTFYVSVKANNSFTVVFTGNAAGAAFDFTIIGRNY